MQCHPVPVDGGDPVEAGGDRPRLGGIAGVNARHCAPLHEWGWGRGNRT
ncbi:hypothetical protein FM119_00680 [Mycetocola reblochoni REB411]|uniref:Uncharacterized protein n=1 Tax=Mycetocola reblochoni REB411 TaxID=1255698 RepID=A0A1R4IAF7_9MICO|nr:hypothetical protein FM119_00680 [Mycetocola reblochoni REB411]